MSTPTKLPIADIRIGKRFRTNLGDVDALAASITESGLLHPVVVTPDHLLIAGERRLAAVKRLGWKDVPVHVVANLDDLLARRKAEQAENAIREPHAPLDAAALADWLAKELKPKADEREKAGKSEDGKAGGRGKKKIDNENPGGTSDRVSVRRQKTSEQAAAATGYSEKTLRKVNEIKALSEENPGLLDGAMEDLRSPKAKVDAVYQKALAQVKASITTKAAARVKKMPDGVRIEVARMEDFLPTLHDIDAIITDPPYPEKFLPLYGELARLAKAALKPDGVLAVMCGQSYLPRIMADMCAHMPYRWTMAYLTPGQKCTVWTRRMNTAWKPILLFGGTTMPGTDIFTSDANDKDHHHWGQSESGMARLVEALTEPGQTVCDPFLGGGTTALVSVALGRKFVGCDIEEDCTKTSIGRVQMFVEGSK